MAQFEDEIKVLETVDLTGDEPVHERKTIIKKIPVVNLDGSTVADKMEVISDDLNDAEICEICKHKAFKYRCPACNTKTCSLLCARSHKEKYKCSGERDKTGFVSRSGFDNFHLLSDYRFLEEATRIADNAKRDYKSKPSHHLGKQGNILRKAAVRNGVQLFRMAKGMQRWKENRSRFHIKEQILYWTVKFIFKDINNEEIITRCSDSEIFESILAPYISKEHCSNDNLKKFSPYIAENNNASVMFKHELKAGENNKRYSIVSLKDSLKDALNGKSVLEYPYFVVLSKDSEQIMEELFTKNNVVVNVDNDEDSDCDDDDNEDQNYGVPNAKRLHLE